MNVGAMLGSTTMHVINKCNVVSMQTVPIDRRRHFSIDDDLMTSIMNVVRPNGERRVAQRIAITKGAFPIQDRISMLQRPRTEDELRYGMWKHTTGFLIGATVAFYNDGPICIYDNLSPDGIWLDITERRPILDEAIMRAGIIPRTSAFDIGFECTAYIFGPS